jgi:bilirubin oxidase
MSKLRPNIAIAGTLLVAGCAGTVPAPIKYAIQGLTGFTPSAPTGQPLREPPVLRNMSHAPHTVEVDLTVKQQAVQVANGPATQMFVFADTSPGGPTQGTFPGPALEATEGDKVIVHLHNRIPQPTTDHFHGLVIPIEQDGAPMNLTPPGDNHTYTWTARPGFPMTTWYHAHPHGYTHMQVSKGMEAPMRILPKQDLLKAYGATTVFLSDIRLDPNNQIPPDTEEDRVVGREGNMITVNGQVLPKLTLRPGEIRRLRIGAFAPARFFNLQIPGLKLLQVGTDGGPIPHPVPRDTILLSTAERAEVLIQAPPVAGKSFTLLDLPYDRGFGKASAPIPLMTIAVAGAPITPPPVPQNLRAIQPIVGGKPRTFELSFPSFGGGVHHFGINGRLFDPLRIDNVATFGATEVYTIENKTGSWDHPMHLHSTQFQVLDVDGVRPPEGLAWKDTVNVPRNKTAHIAVRYDGFTGHYMFHCHILQHENDGLMTTVFVARNAPPFQLPRTSDPFALREERQLAAWCGPAAPPPLDTIAEAVAAPGLAPWPVGL